MRNYYRILLILLAVLIFCAPTPTIAQGGDRLEVRADAAGTHVEWRSAPALDDNLAPSAWPPVTIGGLQLPARLVALAVDGEGPVTPVLEGLTSRTWRGALQPAPAVVPQTVEGELRPALSRPQAAALPDSPAVVLRDARFEGRRVVVLAISPLFDDGSGPQAATSGRVRVPGARPLSDAAAPAPAAVPADAAPQPDPAAKAAGWRIRVTRAGVQRLPAAALAAAGLNLGAVDRARLQLRRNGAEVALEVRGANELRFFAPTPGDRWNGADTYILTLASSNGVRMATRTAAAGSGTVLDTAVERGVWSDPKLYDSLAAGLDGDHWFAADMKTGPGLPAATLTVPLTPTLPLAAGQLVLTVNGSAYTAGANQLQASGGGASAAQTWSGAGTWTESFTLGANPPAVQLALLPGAAPSGVEPDTVAYQRPVTLSFAGKGAFFDVDGGSASYRLSGTPAGRTLYEVSNTAAPVIVTIPDGATTTFQDGTAARRYVLAGPGTLHEPAVAARPAVDLARKLNADTVYIAPASLHGALAPLVARRQAQGYKVAVVDVQAIYDTWSYGQVAPAAIRGFLQYARSTWDAKPQAVTLVGDGTSDPRNYTRRLNLTLVPPYLADVDPWIGETACETCYAQLDGDDPLSDAMPDVWLGRLPVKSAAELTAVVTKLVGYETASGWAEWRSRAAFLADNAREKDGRADTGGDFAAFSEGGIALLPPNMTVTRVYFDPFGGYNISPLGRVAVPELARAQALAALNAGPSLVVYSGHSNQFQMAVTDPSVTPSYLLGLFDADGLTNGGRLPIMLQMTCLTGAFQTPANSGTSIDERFLLAPNGGAAAVWGATGLGVSNGHDALQRGFLQALARAPAQRGQLGGLVQAGYLELFANGGCCEDALRTFSLLGDPRTPARVEGARRSYVPSVRR